MAGTIHSPLRKRIVTRPACRGESIYDASNAYRPFCSGRCRTWISARGPTKVSGLPQTRIRWSPRQARFACGEPPPPVSGSGR